MKRLRIFVGAGAFLLCIVTPLFAQQVDIKTTGQIRVRYRDWQEFLMNNDLPVTSQGGQTRDRHYFDVRTRFGVTAKIEPGLTGVIELERYDDFGNHSTFGAAAQNRSAQGAPGSSTDVGGVGGDINQGIPTNTDSIYFRQAFVDWAIPGTPIHIAGGRQLYTVGGSVVFSSAAYGADGIQVYSQLGPGTLGAYWWKPQTDVDRRFGTNDFNLFGGSYKFEWMARNTVELYGMVSQDKSRAANFIRLNPGNTTGGGSSCGAAASGTATGVATSAIGGDCGFTNEFYAGASFFGVQGPFTYRAEGAYQGGTARKNVINTLSGVQGDIDREAFMIVGGVSYALVPELSLNLDGGWASGDDSPGDNTYSNFASVYGLFQPTLLFSEGNPYGNTAAAQFGNQATNRSIFGTTFGTQDLDLATNAAATLDNNGQRFSPGMFYAKPGVKWVPFKQLTINGDVGLLWAAVSPGGVSSYIGTEADIKAAWQVYKNLVVNWYFAYLFAGGYFDGPAGQVGHNVDDPWLSTIEFILTF